MRLAVMSDLHDNLTAWEAISAELKREGIKVLINCGDTVQAETLATMTETFPGQIHTIFGNNGDPEKEKRETQDITNLIHHGESGRVLLEGIRVGFVHRPEPAELMVRSGDYDLVCHGHTHLKRWEKVGLCYILNPGTSGGVFQYPSFAIVDLPEFQASFLDITSH